MIYVLWLVLDGNSSRAVAAIWLYTLCDRYSITSILPVFFRLLNRHFYIGFDIA